QRPLLPPHGLTPSALAVVGCRSSQINRNGTNWPLLFEPILLLFRVNPTPMFQFLLAGFPHKGQMPQFPSVPLISLAYCHPLLRQIFQTYCRFNCILASFNSVMSSIARYVSFLLMPLLFTPPYGI